MGATAEMTKQELKAIKKKILRCLTEDFDYGLTKTGKPLARPKKNWGIFSKEMGFPLYTGLDLEMVMDKVVLGLYLAMADMENEWAQDVTESSGK